MRKFLATLLTAVSMFSCVAGLTACKKDEPLLNFTLSEDGTYYICGYVNSSAPEQQIVIPSVYQGKPVAEIGHFYFENLESVTIPDRESISDLHPTISY